MGERATVVKHSDNLRLEGEFAKKQTQAVVKGERATVKKHQDNLRMEGQFEGTKAVTGYQAAERATVVKHADNLKMEGDFAKRQMQAVGKGERAIVAKHQDQLKVEGKMEFESSSQAAAKAINKVNFDARHSKRQVESSIVIGDDKVDSKASRTTVQKIESKVQKDHNQNASAGVASTVVQSKSQEAAIAAVSKDNFVSSLRESSGVQIGVQKDLSAIEHHRRQSMYNSKQIQQHQQQQQHYDTTQRWSHSAQHQHQQQMMQQQQQMHQYQSRSSSSYAHQQQMQQVQQVQQQQQQQQYRSSGTRRRTWAESSVFHGEGYAGIAGALAHDRGCPATRLYTQETPYKFTRQTSSGHKVFLPNITH